MTRCFPIQRIGLPFAVQPDLNAKTRVHTSKPGGIFFVLLHVTGVVYGISLELTEKVDCRPRAKKLITSDKCSRNASKELVWDTIVPLISRVFIGDAFGDERTACNSE